MKAVIQADELAKDVAGAEALLERHLEHKAEMDARADSFAAIAHNGEELLTSQPLVAEVVKESLINLAQVDHLHFSVFCFLFFKFQNFRS